MPGEGQRKTVGGSLGHPAGPRWAANVPCSLVVLDTQSQSDIPLCTHGTLVCTRLPITLDSHALHPDHPPAPRCAYSPGRVYMPLPLLKHLAQVRVWHCLQLPTGHPRACRKHGMPCPPQPHTSPNPRTHHCLRHGLEEDLACVFGLNPGQQRLQGKVVRCTAGGRRPSVLVLALAALA